MTIPTKADIKWYALAACATAVLLFLFIALARLFYPYELEGIEGGTFAWLSYSLRTGVVFPPANLDFIPYNYSGLHIYLALLPSYIVGSPSFITLRLISILVTLGTAYLAGKSLSVKATPSLILLGAGLYLATYFPLYTWYDLGRVDSLAAFFAILGLYLVSKRENSILLLIGGIVVGLSFATKQVFLAIALPATIYALARGIKPALIFLLGFVLGGPMVYLLIDKLNNGNSWLYIYEIPSHFSVGTAPIKFFVLLKHLAMMAPLFIFALWQFWREMRVWEKGWFKRFVNNIWALALFWELVACSIFIMQLGAAGNTLMVFAPFLAILAGRWVIGPSLAKLRHLKAIFLSLGIVFCILSDGWIIDRIPTPERLNYYQRLVNFLSEEERPYIPEFPDLVLLAGKLQTPDGAMVLAISKARTDLAQEFSRRVEEQYYSLVIMGIGGGKQMWTYNGKYKEVGHDILSSTGISVDFGNYPIQPFSLLIPSNRDETAVLARLKKHQLIP